jgi:hypothetical protein
MSGLPIAGTRRRAGSPTATLLACSGQTGILILKSMLFLAALSPLALPGPSEAQTRQIGSAVYATFERSGPDTELIGLAVGDISPGTKVTIICSGVSCPFSEKVINVAGTVKTLAITDMFVEPVFKAGTIIEIMVTRPGTIGKVFQYVTQSAGDPRVTKLCIKPGSTTPGAC